MPTEYRGAPPLRRKRGSPVGVLHNSLASLVVSRTPATMVPFGFEDDMGVGMRRADDALVENVNRALSALLADGTLAAIYARYGVTHRSP